MIGLTFSRQGVLYVSLNWVANAACAISPTLKKERLISFEIDENGSNVLAQRLGFSLGWKVVLVSQLVCWTGQFIGHGLFEGRSPALLDNIFQAFFMAPFFVILEILQTAFKYEPYPGFRRNVEAKMNANLTAWRAKSASQKRQ
ncbi:hypothetical protein GOP47_0028301 [Adiantum capillus-veneris]|nr:hypothetical protein GOP47_0028301 [Adiantum capillus-veneris]